MGTEEIKEEPHPKEERDQGLEEGHQREGRDKEEGRVGPFPFFSSFYPLLLVPSLPPLSSPFCACCIAVGYLALFMCSSSCPLAAHFADTSTCLPQSNLTLTLSWSYMMLSTSPLFPSNFCMPINFILSPTLI